MNTVNLIGNLTRDPELDSTTAGLAVCRMRLAVPRRPRPDGEPSAVFVTVIAYGPLASAAADHLARGRRIGVTGRLEHREWTADDGGRRSLHEVVADSVEFLDRPQGRDDEPPPRPDVEPALSASGDRS